MAEIALPLLARSTLARRLLLPLVFFVSLVVFLFATFPYDALSQRIVIEGRRAGYDVTVGSLGHAGLLGISAKDVTLKPLNPDAAGGPLEIKLDKLSLRAGLFSLILKKPAIDFTVDAYGGTAKGVAKISSDPKAPGLSALQLDADTFDLKSLPSSLFPGMELIGQLAMQGDVNSLQALEASGGTINFTLKGAAIVKGTAAGFPLPKTNLGELAGGITIDKGLAKFEKVLLRGGDIDADIEGSIRLKPLLQASQADLKIRIKPKDSWLDANPLIKGSMGFLGTKAADGSYSVKIGGTLGHLTSPLASLNLIPH